MKKNRIQEIDIATGMVIILMMIGHLVPFDQYIFKVIFSFHMPFFFLKSGFCTSDRSLGQPFWKYGLHKVRKLLIPTLLMNTAIVLIGMARPEDLKGALYFIFVSPDHEWFVMALFFVMILFWLVVRIVRKTGSEKKQQILLLFIACVMPMVGALAREKGIHANAWLPFRATSVCIGMMFVLLGYILSRWHRETVEAVYKARGRNPLFFLAGGAILLLLTGSNSYINVASGYWGYSDVYFVLTSLFWSAFMLWIGYLLTGPDNPVIRLIRNILSLIGRHSLLFYFGQSLLYFLFNQWLSARRGVTYTLMVDLPVRDGFAFFFAAFFILLILAFVIEYIENKRKERMIPDHTGKDNE